MPSRVSCGEYIDHRSKLPLACKFFSLVENSCHGRQRVNHRLCKVDQKLGTLAGTNTDNLSSSVTDASARRNKSDCWEVSEQSPQG